MTEPEYLTVKEVAKYLRVSERTVRNYIVRKDNPLPSSKPGGRVLIQKQQLTSWSQCFR